MDDILKKLELWCSTYESRSYAQGDIVVRLQSEPTHVFFLRSGYVRLYTTTADGREVTLAIFKPGTVFPLSFIISHWQSSDSYAIEAITPIKVFVIPTHLFISFSKKNVDISWFLLTRFSSALSGVMYRLEQALLEKPQELIGVISYLASQFGVTDAETGDVKIPFSLTSEQLATWTGTARETVARTISSLKKKGLLRTERKKMIIKNIQALRSSAI